MKFIVDLSNNKEIERKYFIKDLPNNFKISKILEITQSYLYRDGNTTIRIRKIKTNETIEYVYTVKTNGDIQNSNELFANKYEIESNISKTLYEELLNKKISNTVIKTRIVFPIQDNLKVEIDVYHNYLKDFLTAEIEFPNEEIAKNFEKPSWLGEEIGYKDFSNGKLSIMTRETLLSKVPKEVLENNRKLICELL